MSPAGHLLNLSESDKSITKPHIHFSTMPCNFMITNKYQRTFSHTQGYFQLAIPHWYSKSLCPALPNELKNHATALLMTECDLRYSAGCARGNRGIEEWGGESHPAWLPLLS
jgi:hypothetical protein